MRIQQPTKDELTPFFIEATANQTAAEWETKMLSGIAGILRKQPLRYRTYGPYWWLVKAILIDHGITDFGGHIDQEWFDALDYGDPVYNLLAAWAYEDTRFMPGQMAENPYHALETEDGDSIDYTSGDEEMEIRALSKNIRRK